MDDECKYALGTLSFEKRASTSSKFGRSPENLPPGGHGDQQSLGAEPYQSGGVPVSAVPKYRQRDGKSELAEFEDAGLTCTSDYPVREEERCDE
ncbi:uncharacterized protein GLRG_10737 [Colletotrichum graminicola M1.001]|uniref:Uncharacterized protein n=1 Tax=Colletotrichum graminicola (strain M1.001 / M2 / FGSC 10212) TaxID=645133 RepID=E3QXK5_COLGM|nr:uncharacterized protein GLRG_10737 [Colletotrichum graminicola M1.001]EFQ35593.1 hypothetical protein GLRG_10737 [Colletotrichum graminicola M1.001]